MDNKVTDVVTGKTGAKTDTQDPQNIPMEVDLQDQGPFAQHYAEDPSSLYCDALNEQNVNQIADGKKMDIVVLVGFEEYGKSTFASSLYYSFFSKETFCNHVMYDADTYSGFERRLLIRGMKTNPEVKTQRTIKGENPLLAMSLYSETNGKYKLIVSDRSGEDYSGFTGTDEEILDNQILSVANHIVFFIDCERMVDNFAKLRHGYNNCLKSMVEHDMLAENAHIVLAFNKYDRRKDDLEYGGQKKKTEELFRTLLNGRSFDCFEIDSTGASDDFSSVASLTQALLLNVKTAEGEKRSLLDWVNKELDK